MVSPSPFFPENLCLPSFAGAIFPSCVHELFSNSHGPAPVSASASAATNPSAPRVKCCWRLRNCLHHCQVPPTQLSSGLNWHGLRLPAAALLRLKQKPWLAIRCAHCTWALSAALSQPDQLLHHHHRRRLSPQPLFWRLTAPPELLSLGLLHRATQAAQPAPDLLQTSGAAHHCPLLCAPAHGAVPTFTHSDPLRLSLAQTYF
jgi:hypothetical protein